MWLNKECHTLLESGRGKFLTLGNLEEVDNSKSCYGHLPGEVRKEHPAWLKSSHSDARTLGGVLGSVAFE